MGKAVKLADSDQIINKAGSPGASLSGIAPVYPAGKPEDFRSCVVKGSR